MRHIQGAKGGHSVATSNGPIVREPVFRDHGNQEEYHETSHFLFPVLFYIATLLVVLLLIG